jgi:lysophospholipase L1-like esterase
MLHNSQIALLMTLFSFTTVHMLKASPVEDLNANAPQTNTVNQFHNNDNIVFIGDSITCGGFYITYLRLFYATRYPQRNIRMHDCGIGSDTAAGALSRIEWDILSHKPNKATLMLGANDLGFRDYGADKTDVESLSKRNASLEHYKEFMQKLAVRLLKDNIPIIFLTSTIYDQTAQIPSQNHFGFNDALGTLADYLQTLARKYNSSYVDFYHPLNAINAQQQQKDPSYTIIGPDRSHPGPIGHFVMAYTFLKSQNHSQYVAKAAIDVTKRVVSEEINCKISKLIASHSQLTFNCLEASLPFPVPNDLKDALDLVPFQQELNNEIIEINGLPTGRYTMLIDNIDVGCYSNSCLAQGINLARNNKTPQFKKAWTIYKAIFKIREIENVVRMYARVRHLYLKNSGIEYDNMQQFDQACRQFLERVPRNERFKIYQNMVDAAVKYNRNKQKYNTELETLHSSIYKSNQPVKHTYRIKRIDAKQ